MSTNELVEQYENRTKVLLDQYEDRGILEKEIRSYEVSLWTLQDDFITVLKWSDVRQKGRIENPKMILDVDGTEKINFDVPMYYHLDGQLIENPNWYIITEDKYIIQGLRKIKVIFNKSSSDEAVFEFLITNITEEHDKDILTCKVEGQGLAFQELGKIGYKKSLTTENFEAQYLSWATTGNWENGQGQIKTTQPVATVNYWCEEAGLTALPATYAAIKANPSKVDSTKWYYSISMNHKSFVDGINVSLRSSTKVYEEPYATSWNNNLQPLNVTSYKEKARLINVENSNIYNITQNIAETFGIFCRYEYIYDENYHIICRVALFYNNFFSQENGILSFSYPYSTSKVSRNLDCDQVTTKLYVLDAENNTILNGYNTIMNAPPNKSREDYILNFEYLHDTGAITKEQYAEITQYEKDMHTYNEQIIRSQQTLAAYQTQQPEIEAKIAVYEKSIDLDKEQIKVNTAAYDAADAIDNVVDGYLTLTFANPDQLLVQTDDTKEKFLNLKYTNKGIKEDTIQIYKTLTVNSEGAVLSDQISGTDAFSLHFDEYNNLDKIIFKTNPNVTKVYLTYSYQPQIYYERIIKVWQTKWAQDTKKLNEQKELLGEANASGVGISGLLKKISDLKDLIASQKREKDAAVRAFEQTMGPAIREGYWQPEDYSDYGDPHNQTGKLTITDITADSGDEALITWDSTTFDAEDTLDYAFGIEEQLMYYPCIDLIGVYGSIANIPTDLEDYSLVWKGSETSSWSSFKNLQIFSVGSQAVIKFINISTNVDNITIYKPVLMILGASSLTDTQLQRLLFTGEARLEKYSTSVNSEGTVTISHGTAATQKTIGNNWLCYKSNTMSKPADWTAEQWNKFVTVGSQKLVYPRIKFSSLDLKTDTTNLIVKYSNHVLEPNYDYFINIRDTSRNNSEYTEYFICIKPEVLIKYGINNSFIIDYVLSNANTAIYLDALQVAAENAYPKVSYAMDINVFDTNISHTLYNKRAQIIMINDYKLKFENVWGYISHLELDLDAVWNDRIEIKNYKNKFEDLFSSIVATTEAMKQAESAFEAATNGNLALSDIGLLGTLRQNNLILEEYLNSYFDSSQVVKDTLTGLFTEAGEILASSNKSLNNIASLTLANADILSGFVSNITAELTPQVFNQSAKPENYKVGDIWINGSERYVATSSSSTSKTGDTYGFVKTYNGTLAQIIGANMSYDANTGIVDIYGQHEINLMSGEHVTIAAGDTVDITGNNAVNIGGTQLNFGSTSANTQDWGGINLVASSYDVVGSSTDTTSLSKVLINPKQIELGSADILMRGSDKIQMITSRDTITDTSAIEISPDTGVWIGSGKGVTLFSGDVSYTTDANGNLIRGNNFDTNGASVELNSEHLIFGYANTLSGNSNAIEIDENQIVIASGVATVGNADITGVSGGLVGAKFTKDSIGMAVTTNDITTAMLMNENGFTVGSAGIDVTTANLRDINNGSYTRINEKGIELGSLADLYINTNNFKLQTHSRDKNQANTNFTDGETILALGSNLQNIDYFTRIENGQLLKADGTIIDDTTVRLLVNKNGLFLHGTVYADNGQFTGDVIANTFVAESPNNNTFFKVDNNHFGFYLHTGVIDAQTNEEEAKALLQINPNGISCEGDLSVEASNSIIMDAPTGRIAFSPYRFSEVDALPVSNAGYRQGDLIYVMSGTNKGLWDLQSTGWVQVSIEDEDSEEVKDIIEDRIAKNSFSVTESGLLICERIICRSGIWGEILGTAAEGEANIDNLNPCACGSGCTTTCSGACGNGCGNGCGSGCTGGCKTGCTGGCKETCSGGCQGCTSTCMVGCGSGCSGQCSGCTTTCSSGCGSGCGFGCSGECQGCTSTCMVGCGSGCSGECTTCTTSCSAACGTECNNGCKGNAEAATCNDCADGCTGNCGGNCTGCTSDCTGSCSGCTGDCTGTCSGCTGDCTGTCSGCTGDCTGTCSGCTGDCTGTCSGCTGDCTGTCSECTGSCTGYCQGDCALVCSWGCQGSCKNSCAIACANGCTGVCAAFCSGNCTAECTTKCSNNCTNTCMLFANII